MDASADPFGIMATVQRRKDMTEEISGAYAATAAYAGLTDRTAEVRG